MKVLAVPCHIDNYAWILYCDKRREALIIDACEGIPLLAALDRLQLTPVAVCCTHHHADHTGGLPELQEAWPKLPVFCHLSDMKRISGATDALEDGVSFVFRGFQGKVLHTPGHTLGSVCYLFEDYLFTGDTLFGGGCGRMFEGQPSQMAASLQRLAALPRNTKVCFAHEYTLANLKFALFVEPENKTILARREAVKEKRQQGVATAPSSLDEELLTNPFLRCDEPALISFVQEKFDEKNDDYSSIFSALRRAKDSF